MSPCAHDIDVHPTANTTFKQHRKPLTSIGRTHNLIITKILDAIYSHITFLILYVWLVFTHYYQTHWPTPSTHRSRHSSDTVVSLKLTYLMVKIWSDLGAKELPIPILSWWNQTSASISTKQLFWIKSKSYKIQCDQKKNSPVRVVVLRKPHRDLCHVSL